jgi:hypothetical protein
MSRVGIFAPVAHGDVITVTSALHYKDLLWPGADVVWFCNEPHADALRHNDSVEMRPFPAEWVDNVGAALGLKDANNRLSQSRKSGFDLTRDLDDGFFPVPWMFTAEQRRGVPYPNVSKRLFGVPGDWPWHPVLAFSVEEKEKVRDLCLGLPHKRTVMLETEARSGHSAWNDGLTRRTMRICRELLGACNFIFASKSDSSRFFDDEGVASCADLTVRQTSLVNDYSDLFVGVSSGISVATSRWGAKPTPKIQYCGDRICSTVDLAVGHISLIDCSRYVSGQPPYDCSKSEWAFELELRRLLETLR